jgi:DNA-binding MarR family transcriptional regulator
MHDVDPDASKTGKLIYEILRLYGRLIASGDALVDDLGLTSARWMVLGTVQGHCDPLTVSELARIIGQSRQSIQRLANEMLDDGLIVFSANPVHRRAHLLLLTEKGKSIADEVEQRRIAWTQGLAAQISNQKLSAAIEILAELRGALDRRNTSQTQAN